MKVRIIKGLYFILRVQAYLKSPPYLKFQRDLYCSAVENTWERRLDQLNFDDVTKLCDNTMTIWMRNPFTLCATIARKAYVRLAAWFPALGAYCCRWRVLFSCTASTWWVWQRSPENNGFSYLSLFVDTAVIANMSCQVDIHCDVAHLFMCRVKMFLWLQCDVSLAC